MAKKYIDEKNLNDFLCEGISCHECSFNEIDGEPGCLLFARIDKLPAADVVEVVLCKYCKFASPNSVYGCRLERYNYNDESVRMYGEDYCSCGKRRTDGEEVRRI